jgi:hypothetical protein
MFHGIRDELGRTIQIQIVHKMFLWNSTAFDEMFNRAAMSLADLPSATSCSTSLCRGVRFVNSFEGSLPGCTGLDEKSVRYGRR